MGDMVGEGDGELFPTSQTSDLRLKVGNHVRNLAVGVRLGNKDRHCGAPEPYSFEVGPSMHDQHKTLTYSVLEAWTAGRPKPASLPKVIANNVALAAYFRARKDLSQRPKP